MTNPKRAILLRGKEKSLSRKHPWIFSGALKSKDKDIEEGDLVRVFSSEGEFLCIGHWQNGSIAVKVLSFENERIDYGFVLERIRTAVELRQTIGMFTDKDTTIFRLVNGEGDFMPSLIADYYDGLVVVQFHSIGMYLLKEEIVQALKEILQDNCKAIYCKSSSTLPKQEGIIAKDEFMFGNLEEDWYALENGIRYKIDYALGQKTGFFIDQKDNRKLVCEMSKGKKVLNTFAYTGGFSLSAIKGGAKEVVSVDISSRAVAICESNAKENFPQSSIHRGETADVLKYLDDIEQGRYDLIILDPPAFAKHQRHTQQALKGYRAINRKAIEKIASGGLLFTFSCSQAVSSEEFNTMVFSCAALSGRKVRIIKRLEAGLDHPQSIFHPEGEYLKGLLLYVE